MFLKKDERKEVKNKNYQINTNHYLYLMDYNPYQKSN